MIEFMLESTGVFRIDEYLLVDKTIVISTFIATNQTKY